METTDLNQKLTDFRIKLAFKQAFSGTELNKLFALYNEVFNESKKVTSCSACVSSVISKLKAECRRRNIL